MSDRWIELLANPRWQVDTRRSAIDANGWLDLWLRVSEAADRDDFASAIAHWKLDCAGMRIMDLGATYYDASGKVLSQRSVPFGPWQPVVPETMAEAVVDAACRHFRRG